MIEILQFLAGLALYGFGIYCTWLLVKKTGHPGWLCILLYIPLVNIGAFLYLVFWEWPAEEELRRYKERFGELEPLPEVPLTECLQCGNTIKADDRACSACGWTKRLMGMPVERAPDEDRELPRESMLSSRESNTECLQCGKVIASGETTCSACGWTYL